MTTSLSKKYAKGPVLLSATSAHLLLLAYPELGPHVSPNGFARRDTTPVRRVEWSRLCLRLVSAAHDVGAAAVLCRYDELEAAFFVACSTAKQAMAASAVVASPTQSADQPASVEDAWGEGLPEGMNADPLQLGDDGAKLLDLSRKEYVRMVSHRAPATSPHSIPALITRGMYSASFRGMILRSSISVLDFRQYLFASQCKLLFALGQPGVVAVNALSFIESVASLLDKQVHEGRLAGTLADAWVYTACVDMAEVCQRKSASTLRDVASPAPHKESSAKELSCVLGGLFLMARDRLGSLAWTLHGWQRPTLCGCCYPNTDRGAWPAAVALRHLFPALTTPSCLLRAAEPIVTFKPCTVRPGVSRPSPLKPDAPQMDQATRTQAVGGGGEPSSSGDSTGIAHGVASTVGLQVTKAHDAVPPCVLRNGCQRELSHADIGPDVTSNPVLRSALLSRVRGGKDVAMAPPTSHDTVVDAPCRIKWTTCSCG